MDLGLRGRRAVVAAATTGLGFACAEALIAEGAQVAIGGHDERRLEAAAVRLGGATVPVLADLTDPTECAAFVMRATEHLGGVDIMVTNGPGPPAGTFATIEPAAYPEALDLSLLSVVNMVHAAVPSMRAQRWGRIVAVTSIAVRQPIPQLILSNTARAGATGFLKTVAREIAHDGVTVNSVLPGLHDTARVKAIYGSAIVDEIRTIPAGELGRPQDLGAVVTFLCSEQARYITGLALPVAGGLDAALL